MGRGRAREARSKVGLCRLSGTNAAPLLCLDFPGFSPDPGSLERLIRFHAALLPIQPAPYYAPSLLLSWRQTRSIPYAWSLQVSLRLFLSLFLPFISRYFYAWLVDKIEKWKLHGGKECRFVRFRVYLAERGVREKRDAPHKSHVCTL